MKAPFDRVLLIGAVAGCGLMGANRVESAPIELSVSRSTNLLHITWSAQYTGAQLQETTDACCSWTDVANTVTTNSADVAITGTTRLFRLFAPSIPLLGLFARYDLNGDASDSVGGHHGIVHGATPTSNRFLNGSSALSFDGTDDYVEIPDHDDFSVSTTGQFSVSVWMRPGTRTFPHWEPTGYVHWLGKGQEYQDNGDQEWVCRMYNEWNTENPVRTNRISFYVFNAIGGKGAGSYVQDPVEILVYLHFVATVDVAANTIKWYKNGVLRDMDTLSSYSINPQNGPAPVRFGTQNFFSYFKGSIDNVLFYRRVLSAFEVQQLYNDQTR